MQGDTGRFHPSPTSSVHPEHLQYFDLAGRLAGLAAREGATLPAPLSLPLLRAVRLAPRAHGERKACADSRRGIGGVSQRVMPAGRNIEKPLAPPNMS